MKIRNDKEIIIGKINNIAFVRDTEVPFFVKDIKQLCFYPFASDEYKYLVIINMVILDEDVNIYITKEQYDYLQEKLGANDDENR